MIAFISKSFKTLLPVFALSLFVGCRLGEPTQPVARVSRPTSFDAPLSEPHIVGHSPETCDLCSLYHKVSRQVVRLRTEDGQGSGVVVSGSGHIVTNAHVVEDSETPKVETYAGDTLPARTIRRAANQDLALVAVESPRFGWEPIQIMGGNLPAVGTDVYVIGHPAGLGWTVTRGIVSAVRKPGEIRETAMIQTDAAISPGNSGGPLLDRRGRLLGVVVAKLIGRGIENIAFAIPASEVAQFLAEPTEDPTNGTQGHLGDSPPFCARPLGGPPLPVRLLRTTPTNLMKAASGGLPDHGACPTPP